MAWAKVGQGSSSGASPSVSVSGGTVQVGDLLVLAVCGLYQVGIPSSSAPSGSWSLIGRVASSTFECVFYWRVATAADVGATYTVSFNGGAGIGCIGIGCYHDLTQVTQGTVTLLPQLDQFSTNADGSAGTNHVASSITAMHNKELLVGFYGLGGNTAGLSNSWTPPGGMTEDVDLSSSSPFASLEIVRQFDINAGATGSKTAVSSRSGVGFSMLASFFYVVASTTVSTVSGGALVMDDSITNTKALAGTDRPVRLRFRYEQRDPYNRFIRDITTAVLDGEIDLDNERTTLRTFKGKLDATLLPQDFDLLRHRLAVWCDVWVPESEPAINNYRDYILNKGPIGYWRLGDAVGSVNARDEGPNLMHGVYNNGVTLGVPGALVYDTNTAAQFSAAALQNVSVAYNPAQDLTQFVTVSLFFKVNSLPGTVNAKTLFTKNTPLGSFFMRINNSGPETDMLQWYIQDSGGGFESHCAWPIKVPIGQWVHAVGTYDATTAFGTNALNLYINGVLVDQRTRTGTMKVTAGGISMAAGENNFDGSLDEVCFFGRVFGAGEVADLWRVANSLLPDSIDTSSFVPSQLGLFKLANPQITQDENGQEVWDINGADECDDLANSWIGDPFNVPAGTKYTDAMRLLINTANLNCSLPNEADVTPVAYTWKPGTSFLTIINDLAYGLGYWDVWAEPDGWITSRRRMYQSWANIGPGTGDFFRQYASLFQPDVIWSGDTDPKMIIPPLVKSPDITSRANVMRFATQDPTRLINTAEARNLDPLSPISLYNQPEKLQQINADYVPDIWVANSPTRPGPNVNMFSFDVSPIVDLILEEAHARVAKLVTMFDPRRQAHETYRITIPDLESDSRWYCFGWTVRLDVDGVMEHKIGKMTDPMQITHTSLTQGIL